MGLIFGIPLGSSRGDDILVWHYDSKGEYTVCSGYKLEMVSRGESSSSLEGQNS